MSQLLLNKIQKIAYCLAKWFVGVCMLFFATQAIAINYNFPTTMPSGCSNAGSGVYNCGNVTFSFGDTVTISGTKPATINISGKLTTNNVIINQSGSLSDLSIVVTGQAQIDYNASINANITAGSVKGANQAIVFGSITTTTGSIDLDFAADVRGGLVSTTGSITLATSTKIASISCSCDVVVGDSSVIAGDVSAKSVKDSNAHAVYQGNITTTGEVKLGYGASVSKSIVAADKIELVGGSSVAGCVQSTGSKTIKLAYADSVQGVCCGSSSCSNSCVTNNTGSSMPANCSLLTPLAYYPMDEASWSGTTGEVTESVSGYNATASSLVTTKPTTASASPAISGTTGTCGYGNFTRSRKDNLLISSTFPNLGASGQAFTITAWIRTTDNTQAGQRILIDDESDSAGYGFSLGDAGTGKVRFYTRGASSALTLDTGNVISNNTWYFVAAVADVPNKTKRIYVYNTSGTQLANVSATWTESSFGSDSGRASIGGETNSAAEATNQFGFLGNIDEVRVYSNALSATQVNTIRQLTHTCPVSNVTPVNFNCVTVGATSNTGHLYTQLAGTSFNVDVVALKADGSVETNYVNSGTKNVTLEWVDGTGSTACASRSSLSPAVSQTVSFSSTDAGRKTVSTTIAKAYRNLRCRVTDANQSTNVVGCSSDNFAVRPTDFTVTSANANADSAGASVNATPVIKAGGSFNLTAATGVLGYDGTPSIDSSKLYQHLNAVQAGALTGSFSAADTNTGSALGASFSYSEVGYFKLLSQGVYDSSFTSVDSANGDCVTGFTASGGVNACSFGNSAITNYFGRFIPDHFAITQISTTTPACGNNFTYFGQDGLSTTFSLAAQNSSNVTTQNYRSTFARLDLSNWTNYHFSASPLPSGSALSASVTAPSGTWLAGLATNIVAKHQISRPTSATSATNITISAAPVDSDGVTMSASAASVASPFYFGRLFMPNTYGSEMLALSVPIEAQYWNGTAYQRNTADSCSVVPPTSIAMTNYKKNLAACETQLSDAGAMGSGKSTAKLSAPGNGNAGSVDLSVNLNTAANQTCNSSTQSSASSANMPWFGTSNPSSRATFGLYKTPVIYMRENF